MKVEIIIMLLILGILVFAVACTPTKQSTKIKDAADAVEGVTDAVEAVEEDIDGACIYKGVEGTATITFLNTANPAEVVIKFDFKPAVSTEYKYPKFPDKGQRFFIKGQGCCPPLNWCKENGIKQGAKINCSRSEIIKGACTPVVFNFPQFEKDGWN